MLNFRDVMYFTKDPPSVTHFKCWFEVFIDMVLTGMFLIVLLSWTCVFYPEASGLLCVYLNDDNYGLAIIDGRYMSSRCLIESAASHMLYFPYILFLQWIILLGFQVFWLYIPRVASKLRWYHEIFTKIQDIEPEFDNKNQAMMPVIVSQTKTDEDVKVSYDKLVFLLTEPSYITKYYVIKNIINILLMLIFITFDAYWSNHIRINQLDFACNLTANHGTSTKQLDAIACNISPLAHLRLYFIVFQILLMIALILTIVSLYSLASIKKSRSHLDDIFGNDCERCFGLPGYNDFILFITMHSMNVKDGDFFLQMVKFVLRSCGTKNSMSAPSSSHDVTAIQHDIKTPTSSFEEEFLIVGEVASALGLRIELHPYYKNHLYECLENVRQHLTQELKFHTSIRDLLLKEMETNPFYYMYLINQTLSHNITTTTTDSSTMDEIQMLSAFEDYLKRLRSNQAWPNTLLLAAAANILRIRILLIQTNSTGRSLVHKQDTFEPHSTGWNGIVVIMSHIFPNFYNIFTELPHVPPKVLQCRRKFILSKTYRARIISEACEQVSHALERQKKPPIYHRKIPSHNEIRPTGATTEDRSQSLALFPVPNSRTIISGDGLAAARLRLLKMQPRVVIYEKSYSHKQFLDPNFK